MNGKRDETRGELAREEAPEYSPDGVDLTLIRWMLSLTPAQRLQALQDHSNAIDRSRSPGAEASREQSEPVGFTRRLAQLNGRDQLAVYERTLQERRARGG